MAVNNLNTPGVGIQPSIVDAKGDLIAGTAADAVGRLAVGTNGQVLVAASGETTGLKWNDPGSVGGLVHINTTSFNAVASQSINNVFSATYDTYAIFGSWVGTADTGIDVRLRASGTDDSSSNYERQILTATGTTLTGIRLTGQTSFVNMFTHNTNTNYATNIIIHNPYKTEQTSTVETVTQIQGPGIVNVNVARRHTLSNSYDGFTLLVASGTITGSISVYGYRKS